MLSYKESEELDDAYFMSLRIAIDNRLTDSNYRFKNFFRADYNSSDLQDSKYIGIIAVGFFDEETILDLGNLHKPMVFVNTDTLQYDKDCVTADFTSSILRATTHLVEGGITDIGMLFGRKYQHQLVTLQNDPQRFLLSSFLNCKEIYQPNYFFMAEDYTAESGYTEMKAIIKKLGNKLPKAFLIGSDSIAIGALRALREEKVPVPKRVSIIGFNDITSAQYVTPGLSTIHVPRNAMAKSAFDLLNEQFQKRHMASRKVTVGTSLIIRGSSI
ncbi:transcriptional regulator, LacI family [Pediococcus ethanolidurans]|uniref:LacI family transcriptional regulator n=2 Tax=Pediococcus ethanolidurans TaxID=319653 RepID=A0A0R2K1M3_9LACO|nr:transcriptional regulator, LacI family [Pediococcus ethanolidurans]GEN94411.1 LacI family transcriptional regulator [Pediococcus ethanolidurans]SER25642.1 LacI family transcriptional regulator [Pediococcus ethanolidurans]